MKYTPGPWELQACSNGGLILLRGKDVRYHPQSHLQIVPEGDARLISAAPDMYEALKDLLEVVEGSQRTKRGDYYHERKAAKEALNKAEGR